MEGIGMEWKELEAIPCGAAQVTVSRGDLVRLVFEVAEREGWTGMEADLSNVPGPVLRSVLIYSMALNYCSSEEIVEISQIHPAIRYLCANHTLEWQSVHVFRRQNMRMLQESLVQLFRNVFKRTGSSALPALEARNRLQRAMRADSMVLDL
jgi:hypothetical protein